MLYDSGFGEVFMGRWAASKTVVQCGRCKQCAVVPRLGSACDIAEHVIYSTSVRM